jgi:hypothetical protein
MSKKKNLDNVFVNIANAQSLRKCTNIFFDAYVSSVKPLT